MSFPRILFLSVFVSRPVPSLFDYRRRIDKRHEGVLWYLKFVAVSMRVESISDSIRSAAVASISLLQRASRRESLRRRRTAGVLLLLLCIRDAHDTMDFPYHGETSHCHSRRRSRSCRCCRDAGPYPVRRRPDDEAPAVVTVRPRRRSSVPRASPEAAIVAAGPRASRSRASAIITCNHITSLRFFFFFFK